MRKHLHLAFLLFSFIAPACAQTEQPPKLVVGIIVDQMRQEYLYRYAPKYGNGGFKRLMRDGFWLSNAHINYVPTETGPGHASVYTGTTPAIHGIVANDWYDRSNKKNAYCVADERYKLVGTDESNETGASPHQLLSTTITDELKLFYQRRSKVVGISLKDRAAVLPAGHLPDGAYWFDSKSGRFITSSFYREDLPTWVKQFNEKKWPDELMKNDWTPLFPLEQYVESGPDESPYENKIPGKEKTTFPYAIKDAVRASKSYELFTFSTYGNEIITMFGKEAITNERMGEDNIPDFLAISFSSTDKLGHAMALQSVELEDMYARLDRTLADFFTWLDTRFGKEYLVFLSADHAALDNMQFLKDQHIPAGYFDVKQAKKDLIEYLKKYFPEENIIEEIQAGQIYLNGEAFSSRQSNNIAAVNQSMAEDLIVNYMRKMPGVAEVYTHATATQAGYDERSLRGQVMRGWNSRRSGDIAFTLEPHWVTYYPYKGTSHSTAYSYDTNVPVLFMGKGIAPGKSAAYHPITDIAATLSECLHIKYPSGCLGNPIVEVTDKSTNCPRYNFDKKRKSPRFKNKKTN